MPLIPPELQTVLTPLLLSADWVLAAANDSHSTRMSCSWENHFIHIYLPHIKLQHNPWLICLSAHKASCIFTAYAVFLALSHTLHYKTIMSTTILLFTKIVS